MKLILQITLGVFLGAVLTAMSYTLLLSECRIDTKCHESDSLSLALKAAEVIKGYTFIIKS